MSLLLTVRVYVSSVSIHCVVRPVSQAHDVLMLSRCAYAAPEVAALATKGVRTCGMDSSHRKWVVRVSTLLTCWHGQETTVAPRSNVACPSAISVWRMTEAFDYCIETFASKSTLRRLTGRMDGILVAAVTLFCPLGFEVGLL